LSSACASKGVQNTHSLASTLPPRISTRDVHQLFCSNVVLTSSFLQLRYLISSQSAIIFPVGFSSLCAHQIYNSSGSSSYAYDIWTWNNTLDSVFWMTTIELSEKASSSRLISSRQC
jgi:hypothetical protein